MHTCKSSTQEVEGGGLENQGYPRLLSKFESSLEYIILHLKKNQTRNYANHFSKVMGNVKALNIH